MIAAIVAYLLNWPGVIITVLLVLLAGIALGEQMPPPDDHWPGPGCGT